MKNITDYFSSSEKETPDKSNGKKSIETDVSDQNAIDVGSVQRNKNNRESENVSEVCDTNIINGDTKNAFQLMMESRNKSIGTNSPGKDLDASDNSFHNDKTTLSARKKLLNEWAELKGGAKRKREEVERDKIIKTKLEKRSKRLKKLLKVSVDSNDSSKDSNDVRIAVRNRKKTKIRKLSCSSDSSNEHVPENETVQKNKHPNRRKKTDRVLVKNESSKRNLHNGNSKHVVNQDVKGPLPKLNGNSIVENQKNNHIRNNICIVDDSSQEGLSTPPALRSWRLRIKLNVNDEVNKHMTEEQKLSNTSSDESISCVSLSSTSELEDDKITTIKKSRKIAPVFIKATPKPKIDQETLKARQEFLMSGTPDVLKVKFIKQKSIEEKPYDVFPSISHVQQKCESSFWNLPRHDFPEKCSPYKGSFTPCYNVINKNQSKEENNNAIEKPKPIGNIKSIIDEIKKKTPDYPVYKSFRLLFEKSGKKIMEDQQKNAPPRTKKRGRPKKSQTNKVETPKTQPVDDAINYSVWSEKYKPKTSEDIIGNGEAIAKIVKWLKSWKSFSQEIISKKKRRNSSSSEFETTDGDSRDSTRLPSNTIILGGPCGSGKSTAVYAICNELGFNVIEINASSKRTGKKLLQDLQEATQSYQVKKGEKGIQNLLKDKKKDQQSTEDSTSDKKMSVILVEDIDIVFDQDEGFIIALQQLIATSKRPIILTTTDYTSSFVQRFLIEYDCVSFSALQSSSLATWCQILCLLEGLHVHRDDIASLIDHNKGDMRKTLLQLQYWVQSGGQFTQEYIPVKIQHQNEVCDEKFVDDDPIVPFNEEKQVVVESTAVHRNCFRSFEIFKHHEAFSIPYYLNLGFLWWNVANLFDIKDFSKRRINKLKLHDNQLEVDDDKSNFHDTRDIEKLKLKHICNFYDSTSFADIFFRKCKYLVNFEPEIKNHSSNFKDSLELGEKFNTHEDMEFVHDVIHTLVDGSIKQLKVARNNDVKLNVGLPGKSEIRWRTKHHVCEDMFRESLSPWNYADRKSSALDYFPALRNISRSETHRAANNTKRGNRFRSYLKDLGLRCSENHVKLACKILWEAE